MRARYCAPLFGGLIGAVLAIGAGGSARADACTTLSPVQSLFGPPGACDFVSTNGITFSNVVDGDSNSHNVTVNSLEIIGLRTPNVQLYGNVVIDGNAMTFLDSISFSPSISSNPFLTPGNPATPFTITDLSDPPFGILGDGGGDTLLHLDPAFLSLDTGTTSSSGPDGTGHYTITTSFQASFELSVDGGATFTAASGPVTFNLEEFAPDADLQQLLADEAPAPEPATLAIFAVGLAAIGLTRRRIQA